MYSDRICRYLVLKGYFLFLLIIPILSVPGFTSAQNVEITLDQIRELSEQHSPQWQQFENRQDYQVSGERASAARLNPAIAYNLEFLDDGRQSDYEHDIYLQKEFRTPGHFRNLRNRRDSRIRLIEHETEQNRAEWLATTRFGFIRIVLMQQELKMVEQLKEHLDRLISASARRAEEGEVSPLDNRLIEMSSYQLHARINEQNINLERLITAWRNRMGFDEDTELLFTGNFEEPDFTFPEIEDLLTILIESPQAKANRQSVEAAGFEEALEQARRFPSFELSAGYKHLTPHWQGFLVGVAIPLPLLNQNTDAIAQARVLEQIERINMESAQKEQSQLMLQLLQAIRTYEEKLTQFPGHLHQPEQFLNSLTISYEEGTYSLTDFLNTLGLMADSYETKFNQLENYYAFATEIEAITGQLFISQ